MANTKETLNRIVQIANNEEAAVARFNDNVDITNRAIVDSLSRTGKGNNAMEASLDMNGNAIINTVMRPIEKRLDGDVVVWGEVKNVLTYTNLIGQNLDKIALVGNNINKVIAVADRIDRVSYLADNLWALSDFATKEYVDTTEQEIITNYMSADTALQTQISGQASVLAEVKEDAMSNMAEIADLKLSKQDKLVAGANITIQGNVISATGGGGGGGEVVVNSDSYRSLDAAQRSQLLQDGTYKDSDVTDGEIFTEDSGKFVEFDKEFREAGYSATYASDMTLATLNGLLNFAEGNGVIVGVYNGKAAVTSDGITWEVYSSDGAPLHQNSLIFDGTQFVTYLRGSVYKSTDGRNWSKYTVSSGPDHTNLKYFIYDGGQYVIFESNKSIWTSPDAITWTQTGTLPSSLNSTYNITRTSNGTYCVLDKNGYFTSSANLTDWSEPTLSNLTISSARGNPGSLVEKDGILVTSQYNGSSTLRIFWSEDGVTWTACSPASQSYLTRLYKVGSKIFASGEKVSSMVYSEDGKTFTAVDSTLPSKYLTAIAYGLGKTCVFYASAYSSPTDVQLTVIAEEPYYEYFLQSLSYTKEEVNNTFSDVSDRVDLAKVAYAGEGICLLTEPVTDYELFGTGPTIDADYIATGFVGANYLTKALDNVEIAKGVVLEAAFKMSSASSAQIFLLRDASNAIVGRIQFTSSGTITGAVGSATITSSSTFLGAKVYVRVAYDTTTLSLYTSKDGATWNLEKSSSLSPTASSVAGKIATSITIGMNSTGASVDLKACSLSYQGNEVWKAVEGVGKTGIAVDDHLKLLVAEVGPSETTVGHIGQIYVNKAGNVAYMCVGADTVTPAYIWKQITA